MNCDDTVAKQPAAVLIRGCPFLSCGVNSSILCTLLVSWFQYSELGLLFPEYLSYSDERPMQSSDDKRISSGNLMFEGSGIE